MIQKLIQWAYESPELAVPLVGWLLLSFVSTTCSVLLRILRAAYPEPADQLPRWMRGFEAGLDEIAMNSRREESAETVLKKIAGKKS